MSHESILLTLATCIIAMMPIVIEFFQCFKKPLWRKLAYLSLIILLLIVVGIRFSSDSKALDEKKAKEEKIERLLSDNQELKEKFELQIDLLIKSGALQGGNDFREKYLIAQHQLNTQVSSAEAESFVRDLILSLPQKKQEAKIQVQENENYIKNLNTKWIPIFDYIVTQYDERVDRLIEAGIVKKNIINKQPLISMDHRRESGTIRFTNFTEKLGIEVSLIPAIIEYGNITASPQIRFYENFVGRPIMSINLTDSVVTIFNHNRNRYSWPNETFVSNETPLDDPNFRETLSKALNQIFTLLSIESQIEE